VVLATPASAISCITWTIAFWLLIIVAQASSRIRKWARLLPGTGAGSIRPTVRSIVIAPEIDPALAPSCSPSSAAVTLSWSENRNAASTRAIMPNHYQKLTALENLQFFAALYAGPTENPMALLESVDLAADAHTRVGQFSKGMQMRLVFARALLHRPELLFLDEPTSGMDPVNARRVKDIVRDLRERGCTVFLTTHDMATAEELCDRVAFVVDGRIAALDTPTEHKVSRSRRTVRVTYRDGNRLDYKDFPLDGIAEDETFRALTRERHVEALHSQEASLEDVFIDVTGRSLA
jgi:fluoroquinolone transport system ATP-binding protein